MRGSVRYADTDETNAAIGSRWLATCRPSIAAVLSQIQNTCST